MRKSKHTKFVHEGKFFAEIEVELIETDNGWSPYLSLEDAERIDSVREALKRNDIDYAKKHASVYEVVPLK